ncbi:MAG: hypothetical protein J5482_02045 [Oscillospiraceae bacterium]|nr:hypothetical protein [Oscillospiraceae bacterium]
MILTNKFGMSQGWSGVIMAPDNILALVPAAIRCTGVFVDNYGLTANVGNRGGQLCADL